MKADERNLFIRHKSHSTRKLINYSMCGELILVPVCSGWSVCLSDGTLFRLVVLFYILYLCCSSYVQHLVLLLFCYGGQLTLCLSICPSVCVCVSILSLVYTNYEYFLFPHLPSCSQDTITTTTRSSIRKLLMRQRSIWMGTYSKNLINQIKRANQPRLENV